MAGKSVKPKAGPSGENGIAVKTAIPAMVRNMTGADAWLWMKGNFGVRIM